MTGWEIFASFLGNPIWTAVLFGIILKLIEVAPVKVNPWSALKKAISRVLNRDLSEKMDALTDKVVSVKDEVDKLTGKVSATQKEMAENEATSRRARIVRFGDELRRGEQHSEENFKQILGDVDYYENFCRANPAFRNNVATITIEWIRQVYTERLKKNDFL